MLVARKAHGLGKCWGQGRIQLRKAYVKLNVSVDQLFVAQIVCSLPSNRRVPVSLPRPRRACGLFRHMGFLDLLRSPRFLLRGTSLQSCALLRTPRAGRTIE